MLKYKIYYRVFHCPAVDEIVKRPLKAAQCSCMHCHEMRCVVCTGKKRMRGGCQDCVLPEPGENENFFRW